MAASSAPFVLGLVAAFCGAVYLGAYVDDDIYYIVALGRSIIESGIPTVDPLTCNEGLVCVAQQWAFCVAAAWLHDNLGMWAVCATSGALWICAALAMLVCVRTLAPGRPRAAALATGAALFIMSMYLKTNPRALDVACVAVCALAMERFLAGRGRRWLCVPVAASAAMANLHCSMWVLAAAPGACALLDGRARGKRRAVFGALALTCAASAASPNGLHGTLYVFTSLSGGLESLGIQELQPTLPSLKSCGILALTPAALAAYAFARGKAGSCIKDVRLIDVLVAAFGVLALLQLRNVLLLLAVVPAAMLIATRGIDAAPAESATRLRRLAMLFVAAAAVLMTLLAAFCPHTEQAELNASRKAAVSAISEAGAEPGATVGNEFNSGSFLEFMGYKPAFDGRAEMLLPQVNGGTDLLGQHDALLRGTDEQAREWISSHNFDVLWLSTAGSQEATYRHWNERMRLAAAELGYVLAYSDENVEAYVRGDIAADKDR